MRASFFFSTSLIGLLGMTSHASAQDKPVDNSIGTADIIVTAQNRSQSVNDVPIAINVVSAEKLSQAGFGNMDTIQQVAPTVQLNQDQGTIKVSIRGVGTTSNDQTQDTSVVVNIDGEYINRGNILGSALFDMERVEVLRGPQGTLYGRNATAGAINFITRKPGDHFGVNATASYGNYNAVRIDAGVDLPLGAVGGLRVAGFYDNRDGYVRHPARASFVSGGVTYPAFAGGRSDDNDSRGGRVSLRLEPSSGLTINLAAEYAKRSFTPQAFASGNLNAPGNGPATASCADVGGFIKIPAIGYTQALCSPQNTQLLNNVDRGNYFAPNYGLGGIDEETWALRGRLSYEFSEAATLSYIAGYRHFDGTSYLTLPAQYRSYGYENSAKTQSHELRLNGVISGITYQVGGFYFREALRTETGFFLPIAPNGSFLNYQNRYPISTSKSLFGQIEVPIAETLVAVGGLRYTDDKRTALFLNGSAFRRYNYDAAGNLVGTTGGPNPGFFNAGPGRKDNFDFATYAPERLNLHQKASKLTWLAGLNYKPNNDTLFYLKASTGYKAGGFDSVGTYKPETNLAYEAGMKLGFGDHGQHQLNLSAFRYDYKDLQVPVLLDVTKGGQTFNAGKAIIWGIEAEATIQLDDNNRFQASFNYLNSRYDELLAQYNAYTVPGTGPDLTGIGDLDLTTPGLQQPNFAGNRREFAPSFVITAGYDHTFDLGSSGSIVASADMTFKSRYFTTFFNQRDGSQSAYTQSNLSLLYRPEDKRFSIQAYVRNLENMRPLTFGSYTAAGSDDVFNWQFGAPRTYGLRLGIDF